MSGAREPVVFVVFEVFEVYEAGVYLHGTKADLAVGEMLVPGQESNFEGGQVMNYIYFTATLDAATWAAELAAGAGRRRIYIVERTGEFEDDPNLTIKRSPGNPTQSFRTPRAAARRRRTRRLGWSLHGEVASHEGRPWCVEAAGRSTDRALSARVEAFFWISPRLRPKAACRIGRG